MSGVASKWGGLPGNGGGPGGERGCPDPIRGLKIRDQNFSACGTEYTPR